MRRVLRGSTLAVAWSILIFTIAMLAVRQLGVTQIMLVALVVGAPYFAVFAAVAAILFAVTRSRVGLVTAVTLALILVGIQIPRFIADTATATGQDITVLTVNVAHGNADAAAIVDEIRTSNADLLAVQELTPAEVDNLTRAGIDDLMPYSFTAALPVSDGTGLWSRTPLTDGTRLSDFGFVPVQANTVIDGVAVTVVAFHAMSPATPRDTVQWAKDLDRMRTLMESYPGTVLVAGDFNATGDHRQFRDLASAGFVDAAERAGSGLFRTFPSNRPLAQLDHVVTSDTVDALEVHPVPIPDSDHLAVSARLRLPGRVN